MKNNSILENFILNANIKHNNKYDYSLAEYKNNKTKIKIICPHHNIFEQRIDHHLSGSGTPCYVQCGFIVETLI